MLTSLRLSFICFCCAVIFSCAILPPVQEMSNARQSIQSAYTAKADVYSGAQLKEAEEYMQLATEALESGDYTTAREYATFAQQSAINARKMAIQQQKP